MRRALGRRGLLPLGLLAVTIALAAVAALSKTADAGGKSATHGSAAASTSCDLGPDISHVINIVFDNVHFARDNPNVPSDLEQMPHLLNFLKDNGTVFSNSHTPLIAHTADDSLSIYTGLYGDRHGQPVSNTYKTYNPDGSTDPATSFTYWTSPVVDTEVRRPNSGTRHDTVDGLLATRCRPDRRHEQDHAGAVGAIHPRGVHGRRLLDREHGARERCRRSADGVRRQLARGRAVQRRPGLVQGRRDRRLHRRGRALRAGRRALRGRSGGEVRPDHADAVGGADLLPTEPGGYTASRRSSAPGTSPRARCGTPNLIHNGYQVTNGTGNLVDLDGNQIQEPFSHRPGSRGSARPRPSRSR